MVAFHSARVLLSDGLRQYALGVWLSEADFACLFCKISDMDNWGRPDWSTIRREREETGVAYRELAERFGVTAAAVEKRAQREGWTVKAKAMQAAVAQLVPTQATLERARERIADRAVEAVTAELSEFLSEAVRGAVAIMAHGRQLAITSDNPRDFRDATAGWALAHDAGRKAHGLDRRDREGVMTAWNAQSGALPTQGLVIELPPDSQEDPK